LGFDDLDAIVLLGSKGIFMYKTFGERLNYNLEV